MSDSVESIVPIFKPHSYYDVGSRVRRLGVGFNAPDVLGTVIGHDFFGAAVVDWDN